MKQTVIKDYTKDVILYSSLVQDALRYMEEGFSFYDTSIKLGLHPNEVIAIYVKDRASK